MVLKTIKDIKIVLDQLSRQLRSISLAIGGLNVGDLVQICEKVVDFGPSCHPDFSAHFRPGLSGISLCGLQVEAGLREVMVWLKDGVKMKK